LKNGKLKNHSGPENEFKLNGKFQTEQREEATQEFTERRKNNEQALILKKPKIKLTKNLESGLHIEIIHFQ